MYYGSDASFNHQKERTTERKKERKKIKTFNTRLKDGHGIKERQEINTHEIMEYKKEHTQNSAGNIRKTSKERKYNKQRNHTFKEQKRKTGGS